MTLLDAGFSYEPVCFGEEFLFGLKAGQRAAAFGCRPRPPGRRLLAVLRGAILAAQGSLVAAVGLGRPVTVVTGQL
jgi:hypothetical protein